MFSSMQDRINYYIGRAPSEGLRYSLCFRSPWKDLKLLNLVQFPVKGSEAYLENCLVYREVMSGFFKVRVIVGCSGLSDLGWAPKSSRFVERS
jgi:hypothetical protein